GLMPPAVTMRSRSMMRSTTGFCTMVCTGWLPGVALANASGVVELTASFECDSYGRAYGSISIATDARDWLWTSESGNAISYTKAFTCECTARAMRSNVPMREKADSDAAAS